ncbi:MAG: hypothetical protein WCC69_05640 [Pirellulales bacterium]
MAIVVRHLESDFSADACDVSAEVTLDGMTRRLAFQRFGNHPGLRDRTDTFDPFAVALLLPAMIRGEPLVIEGTVDERLLLALQGPVQATLCLLDPAWRRVPIDAAARRAAERPRPAGAATAMSGGIDSMHLVHHRLLDPAVPESLTLRLLVHHHVGAHGDDDRVFEEQLAHARRVADSFGLPLIGARCQLADAYRNMPYIHCQTMRNVAASMTLDHLFSHFQYASSEPFGACAARTRFAGIATLEPQLLPLFNTDRVSWHAFGGDATRLCKTADVLADERLRSMLLVCMRGFRRDRAALNCGRCYKCARLLLHAEAIGSLDAVADTFDMAAYRRGRDHSVMRLLRFSLGLTRNAADIDLLAFLSANGFDFPWWSRPGVTAALLLHGRRHSLAA